jgi:hypothetical protein
LDVSLSVDSHQYNLRFAVSSVRRTTKIKLKHFVLCHFSREGADVALHCDESALRLPAASGERQRVLLCFDFCICELTIKTSISYFQLI